MIMHNNNDNTPISLKAILLNRYQHWGGGYDADADRNGFK
jgi:hypothetical protein